MNPSKAHIPFRRSLLLAMVSCPLLSACATELAASRAASAQAQLAAIEAESGGRLGVACINTANGAQLNYGANERFALCSTFKVLAASAVLAQSQREGGLLDKRISYAQSELVTYSPITAQHIADGMTVAELCAAALQYSDNTAGNLLMKLLGGPPAVTAFARDIGDSEFRLDRWETALNTAIPGDPRDTTTPSAMARSLQRLVLGDVLAAAQREQLQAWMLGNTTGATRIRAGTPTGWQIGDKTGTGAYGTTIDIAVLWPPAKPPLIIALYFKQREPEAKPRNDVLASATKVIVSAWSA